MKDSNSVSLGSSAPSLFQIAAFYEEFFPSGGLGHSSSCARNPLPVSEFTSNLEQFMSRLRASKTKNVFPPATAGSEQARSKRGYGTPKRYSSPEVMPGFGKPNDLGDTFRALPDIRKNVKFTLKSSAASSVKLAADFTEWENHALEMKRSKGGVWSTVVQLVPGVYSYRFIVDGQWCDDLNLERLPNALGSKNAIVRVT